MKVMSNLPWFRQTQRRKEIKQKGRELTFASKEQREIFVRAAGGEVGKGQLLLARRREHEVS